jgi:hypothetical protein
LAEYINGLLATSPDLDAFLGGLVDAAAACPGADAGATVGAGESGAAADDGPAWEAQEAAGFAGWPERDGGGAGGVASAALAAARREPDDSDWLPLARRLVRLAHANAQATTQAHAAGHANSSQSATPPPLSLRRTQRGKWRFAGSGSGGGGGASVRPAAAAFAPPVSFQVDDVLSLLGGGEGGAGANGDDGEEEEFMLRPPGLGGAGGSSGKNNTLTGGDSSNAEGGDAAGLPSFFAKGGYVPDGVGSLYGELGGLENDGDDEDDDNGGNLEERLEKASLSEAAAAQKPPPGLPARGILHGVNLPKPPPQPRSNGGGGGGGKGRGGGKGSYGAVGHNKGGNSSIYGSNSNSGGGPRPLIVLDCPNIAMRHGQQRALASGGEHASQFSSRGVALAADFFRLAGHRVVGFLPDFVLDLDKVAERKRLARLGGGFASDAKASQLPDDVQLLRSLQAAGIVVGTPPQDYDDAYSIRYCKIAQCIRIIAF